jgi:hypothetical protein
LSKKQKFLWQVCLKLLVLEPTKSIKSLFTKSHSATLDDYIKENKNIEKQRVRKSKKK